MSQPPSPQTSSFNRVGDWMLKIDSYGVHEGDSAIPSANGEYSEFFYSIGMTQENTCGTGFVLANKLHCEESKDIEACCHKQELPGRYIIRQDT